MEQGKEVERKRGREGGRNWLMPFKLDDAKFILSFLRSGKVSSLTGHLSEPKEEISILGRYSLFCLIP